MSFISKKRLFSEWLRYRFLFFRIRFYFSFLANSRVLVSRIEMNYLQKYLYSTRNLPQIHLLCHPKPLCHVSPMINLRCNQSFDKYMRRERDCRSFANVPGDSESCKTDKFSCCRQTWWTISWDPLSKTFVFGWSEPAFDWRYEGYQHHFGKNIGSACTGWTQKFFTRKSCKISFKFN